jgi:tetratricopeptide (TPR) repeat protein
MILKRLSAFVILVIALSGFLVTSQSLNPDSIKALIDRYPENKRPEIILNLVNDISFDDLKLAENYTKQALNFYIKNNDLKGIAKAYSAYGDIYANNNDFDNSIKYYQKAYELELRVKNPGGAAYNLNSIGFLYFNQNNIDIAIEYFNKALLAAKSKSVVDEANALNSLGTAFRRKGENGKAKEYYAQALSVIKETNEDKTLAKTYQNLGLVNFESGEYETAIKMYLQAEKLRDKIGDLKGQGIALNNIGNVYYSWGKYETAIIYYQKAIKYLKT